MATQERAGLVAEQTKEVYRYRVVTIHGDQFFCAELDAPEAEMLKITAHPYASGWCSPRTLAIPLANVRCVEQGQWHFGEKPAPLPDLPKLSASGTMLDQLISKPITVWVNSATQKRWPGLYEGLAGPFLVLRIKEDLRFLTLANIVHFRMGHYEKEE